MQKSKNSDLKQFENFSSAINFFFFYIFKEVKNLFPIWDSGIYFKIIRKDDFRFFQINIIFVNFDSLGGVSFEKAFMLKI